MIGALRAAASATAARSAPPRPPLRTSRDRLAKFGAAVQRRSVALGEGGHLTLVVARRRKPGWLRAHEHSGSHTIERHVGKTDEEVGAATPARSQHPRVFPHFRPSGRPDEHDQPRYSDDREQNSSRPGWTFPKQTIALEARSDWVVGHTKPITRVVVVDARVEVRAFIVKDDSMTEGFRIVSAYPKP